MICGQASVSYNKRDDGDASDAVVICGQASVSYNGICSIRQLRPVVICGQASVSYNVFDLAESTLEL